MTFAVALLLALGSFGDQPVEHQTLSDVSALEINNASAAPHRHQQSNEGSCTALVERLCTVTTQDMCRTLQRRSKSGRSRFQSADSRSTGASPSSARARGPGCGSWT